MLGKSICVSFYSQNRDELKKPKTQRFDNIQPLELKLDKIVLEINHMYLTDKVRHWNNFLKVDFASTNYFKIKPGEFPPHSKEYGLVWIVLRKAGISKKPA